MLLDSQVEPLLEWQDTDLMKSFNNNKFVSLNFGFYDFGNFNFLPLFILLLFDTILLRYSL